MGCDKGSLREGGSNKYQEHGALLTEGDEERDVVTVLLGYCDTTLGEWQKCHNLCLIYDIIL